MADTKLFLVIISFLVLGTILTGAIISSYNSWMTTGTDFYQDKCPAGTYGESTLCSTPRINVTRSLNFSATCPPSDIIFQPLVDTFHIGPLEREWRCRAGIGYILEGNPPAIDLTGSPDTWILFDKLQLDGNVYKNTYVINNTGFDVLGVALEDVSERNEFLYLEIREFTVQVIGAEEHYDTPVHIFQTANYNLLSPQPTIISTTYNPNTGEISFDINNFKINTIAKIDRPLFPNILLTTHYYGGIGASHPGVNLVSSKIYAVTSSKSDMWSTINTFFGTVTGLFTFNEDVLCTVTNGEYQCIPWFIIVLFIYLPLFALVMIIVDMFMPDWL